MSSPPLIEKFSLAEDYPFVATGEIDNDDDEGLIAWEENINVNIVKDEDDSFILYEYDGDDIRSGLYQDENYGLPISIGFTENYTVPTAQTSWGIKCDSVKLSGDEMLDVTITNVVLPIYSIVAEDTEKWVTGVIDLYQLESAIPSGASISDYETLTIDVNSVVKGTDTEIPVSTGELPAQIRVEMGE